MTKRMVVSIYAAILFITGLLIFFVGFTLGGVVLTDPFGDASTGMQAIGFLVKLMGGIIGLVGIVGIIWTITLSGEQKLPGYAGLNKVGLVVLLTPFIFVGPYWLLIAWLLWLIPPFKKASSLQSNPSGMLTPQNVLDGGRQISCQWLALQLSALTPVRLNADG